MPRSLRSLPLLLLLALLTVGGAPLGARAGAALHRAPHVRGTPAASASAHMRPAMAARGVLAPRDCLTTLRAERHAGHALNLPATCLDAIFGAPATASAAAQAPAVLPTGVITTYAGGASGGGLPTAYGLVPLGVTLNGAGHVLISDYKNNLVWLANLTGSALTTFGQTIAAGRMVSVAGNDTSKSSTSDHHIGDGGPATRARLYIPQGVAVDGSGNLFIADSGNQRIREVVATGVITTVAGNGLIGYSGDGGPATEAELNWAYGVAVDGAGNLFIADSANERIREVVAATGIITTVAGDGAYGYGGDGGPATAAELFVPYDVAVDGAGNLFIADTFNNRIREVVAATAIITTVAGNGSSGCPVPVSKCFGGDGGPATQAKLYEPQSIAVDGAGNLFIADSGNDRIRQVTAATGVITTIAGNGTYDFGGAGGPATQAELNGPTGTAVDGASNLFIADSNNNSVREVVAATGRIIAVAGSAIRGFSGDGGPATRARLANPEGVAVDGAGNLFIADTHNNRIREVVAATGIITTVAGNGLIGYSGDGGAATQAELDWPSGVAVDGAGNLFIADTNNSRVREVVAATGVITTIAGGSAGCPQQADSVGDGCPAIQAILRNLKGVAVDGAGNLFIADTHDQRIREVVAATGLITTVAGNGRTSYGGDGGPATQAESNEPSGVAVDKVGNLFVADQHNNRVREVVAATGIITTIAGTAIGGFSGDGGPATKAELYYPPGVAVDGGGNLFIADEDNNRVRLVRYY